MDITKGTAVDKGATSKRAAVLAAIPNGDMVSQDGDSVKRSDSDIAQIESVISEASRDKEEMYSDFDGQEAPKNVQQEIKSSLVPGEEGLKVNQDGVPVAGSTEDGTVLLSMRTYDDEGRVALKDYLNKCVDEKRITGPEMQEMVSGIEQIYNVCKNALQQYLNENSILYIDPDKKRTENWFSLNRLQLPLGENRFGPVRKITYADGKVKVQSPKNMTGMQKALFDAGIIDEYGNKLLSDRDSSKNPYSYESFISKPDTYIVRSIVNHFKNELSSMDVLYAINAKKELAAAQPPRSTAKPLSVTNSTISISDLLDIVNRVFSDILPESVLKHYHRPAGAARLR